MIAVDNLTLSAGHLHLGDITFDVPAGTYATLTGRTGTGKTTLLEALAGLRRTTSGSIHFAGRDVTRLRPSERAIGYVPQDGALFQTLTVRQNIAFGPKIHQHPTNEIATTVASLAESLNITPLLERKPAHLSGGERQRVALARALALRPSVLLLDEPFSALDHETVTEITTHLATLHRAHPFTALHVTHHPESLANLATLTLVLEDGKVTLQS